MNQTATQSDCELKLDELEIVSAGTTPSGNNTGGHGSGTGGGTGGGGGKGTGGGDGLGWLRRLIGGIF